MRSRLHTEHSTLLPLTLLTFLAIPLSGCGDGCNAPSIPPDNEGRATVQEGLWGNVLFHEGDFMPGDCVDGTIQPVIREMRIHEVATDDDVDQVQYEPFFHSMRTRLVATVTSDSLGFFEVALPPGRYSLFAVEDTLLYANLWSADGEIFPFSVTEGRVTFVEFDITYLRSD